MQMYTSSKTSINKTKLPASTKKINFELFRNCKVLDIGGGRFDNLKDYLKENFNIELYIYDKFNRSFKDNLKALRCQPKLVICNNVLNVVDSDDSIKAIVELIESYNTPFYISVYEGSRTGKGKQTGFDSYQRNDITKNYLHFFKSATIKNNMIQSI